MADPLHSAPGGLSSSSSPSRGTSFVKVGGALGVAGAFIGIAIFVAGCFGFGAAFSLSMIPTLLGGLALALVIVGGLTEHPVGVEDTHALAAIFMSVAVLLGGLLLVCVWLGRPIFAGAGGM
jgi:hypothetical protein